MGRGEGAASLRTNQARGTIRSLPRVSGTYRISLSALSGVQYNNSVPGRLEGVQAARAAGAKLPPIRLAYNATTGEVSITDGNHRLRAARAAGDKAIDARVEVFRRRD